MSRDIPVIFSAPMILALLAGRKTMTRRLASGISVVCNPSNGHFLRTEPRPSTWQKARAGDRLWVRESLKRPEQLWRYSADEAKVTCASKHRGDAARWSDSRKQDYAPSIHMPRWASRLTLVVTEAKVERLQDISEEDAIAEGWPHIESMGKGAPLAEAYPIGWFANVIWKTLHGTESWEQNPEVVALRFEVQKQNIDSMREAA